MKENNRKLPPEKPCKAPGENSGNLPKSQRNTGENNGEDFFEYTSATLKINLAETLIDQPGTNFQRAMGLSPIDLPAHPMPPIRKAEEDENWNKYRTMGTIYEDRGRAFIMVKDINTRRLLIMKVLLLTPELEEEHMQRFLEEAQILAQLEHPGIVPVYEIGLDANERIYFSMPYLPGAPLSDLLKRSERPGLLTLLLLFRQLARAVDYMHRREIYHRNLNPGNVLVDKYFNPYLLGWSCCCSKRGGIEIFAGDANLRIKNHGALETLDGRKVGIINYLAPEIIQQRTIYFDEISEIYALGAILYELVTGQPPFAGNVLAATIEQIRQQQVPKLPRTLPGRLAKIIARAMAPKKAARYQRVAELLQDFEAMLAKGPGWFRHW